jgi:hypothetical protein
MIRMTRQGHELDMKREGEFVRAECECRKWQIDVLVRGDVDFGRIVAHVVGEHEKHLDRLGRQTVNGSDK